MRDGIRIRYQEAGSQHAGSVQPAKGNSFLSVEKRGKNGSEYVRIPIRYEILVNSSLDKEEQLATLCHELGHLYCGHVGTPNEKWWPSRPGLPHDIEEIEAESVCYLVCGRLGIDNPSDEYLKGYINSTGDQPPISIEAIMKATGRIFEMTKKTVAFRKD